MLSCIIVTPEITWKLAIPITLLSGNENLVHELYCDIHKGDYGIHFYCIYSYIFKWKLNDFKCQWLLINDNYYL